jgi:hypothetical protein
VRFVEGEEPAGSQTPGEDDQGGVGEAHPQISVPRHQLVGLGQLVLRQAIEPVRSGGEILEESDLGVDPQPRGDQIVGLGGREC